MSKNRICLVATLLVSNLIANITILFDSLGAQNLSIHNITLNDSSSFSNKDNKSNQANILVIPYTKK